MSAPKNSAEVIAALYTLIFVLSEMSCEDQSLSHRRPKEVVAHWILQTSSLSSQPAVICDGAAEVFEVMYIRQVGTID